jgi:GDSL-like Lipase/Acylhydrolase family
MGPTTGVNLGSLRATKSWTPAELGAAASFILRAHPSLLTLSGSDVVALANDGGTAAAMTAPGTKPTYDTSVTQGGYGSIRTVPGADLRVLTGGPSGASEWHIIALVKPVTAASSQGQDSTSILLGDPGVACNGLGSTAEAQPRIWAGGFNSVEGRSSLLPFDTQVQVLELLSDGGTSMTAGRDGGLLLTLAGATSLSSGQMGLHGFYPNPLYDAPDTRHFWVLIANRRLTNPERALVFAYLKREFRLSIPRNIVVLGDSITQGHVATANTTAYIERMVAQYAGLTTPVFIRSINAGISSQTTAQILARVTPAFLALFGPAGFRREYLIIMGGANDRGPGNSPAQTYANISAMVALANPLGIRTIVGTVFDQVGQSAQDTIDTAALNAMILGNAAGATGVTDLRGVLSSPPTLAELPDHIHPTDVKTNDIATAHRGTVATIEAVLG